MAEVDICGFCGEEAVWPHVCNPEALRRRTALIIENSILRDQNAKLKTRYDEAIEALKAWRTLTKEREDHNSECCYADNCHYGCCQDCDRIIDGLDQAVILANAVLAKIGGR